MGTNESPPACATLFGKINRVPYSIAEEEAVELILAADSGAISKGELTAFLHKHLKIPGN